MSVAHWVEHTGVHQLESVGLTAMVEMGVDGIGDAFQTDWRWSWAVLDDDMLLACGVGDDVDECKGRAKAVLIAMGAGDPEWD